MLSELGGACLLWDSLGGSHRGGGWRLRANLAAAVFQPATRAGDLGQLRLRQLSSKDSAVE